jgi:hypothetical protein
VHSSAVAVQWQGSGSGSGPSAPHTSDGKAPASPLQSLLAPACMHACLHACLQALQTLPARFNQLYPSDFPHAAAAVRLHSKMSKLNFPALYAHMELPLGPAASTGSGGGGSRGSTPPLSGGSGASTPCGGGGAPRLSPFASAAAAGGGGSGRRSRHASPAAATSSRSGGGGPGRGGRGSNSSGLASGRVQPIKGSSRYRGVSWNSNCCKWRAQVSLLSCLPARLPPPHPHPTTPANLLPHHGQLVAPTPSASLKPCQHSPSAANKPTPPLPCPSLSSLQVWRGSEVHHVGYFEVEADAAHAYDEAVLRIR